MLVTIGGRLSVIDVILWVLWILGTTGRAVGGRKHYYPTKKGAPKWAGLTS